MKKRKEIVEALQQAYWKEIETIMNYIANSTNLDGIRAEEIRETLSVEVTEELGHAQRLAARIKELDGIVEGSMKFKAEQKTNQPPKKTTDLESVIQGVIDAEEDAVNHYRKIIELTDGDDYVTQDLAIQLLGDEEGHLRLFKGFRKGMEADRK